MNRILRNINMFKDLSESSLIKIDSIIEEKIYDKGEDIFLEGERSEGVHFIKSGTVKIYKSSSDGREHILHMLEEGEVFAEVCILNELNYPASAKAIEKSHIYIVDNMKLENLIKDDGDVAIELLKIMSKRLVYISKQVETIALKDSIGKVASLIINLMTESEKELKNDTFIKLNLSRQDMANMVSLTRESFTRTLGKLKEMGIIDTSKEGIIVKDIKRLIEQIG